MPSSSQVYIKNKKAFFEYFLFEKFEAGIVLKGSEIKSIRMGGVDLTGSYVFCQKLECYVQGLKIRKLKTTNFSEGEAPVSEKPKKLLLHKKEVIKLLEKSKEQGFTIIPTALYTNKRGLAKLEICIAKGKHTFDKRKTIKERDIKRQEWKERESIPR